MCDISGASDISASIATALYYWDMSYDTKWVKTEAVEVEGLVQIQPCANS